jgi:2'-5' RNA ligase
VRLFVALHLSDAIQNTIEALSNELRPLDKTWKWVAANNLHLTLKFLGEIPEERVAQIQEALTRVPVPEPIAVEFRGLGFFPNERRPRVLWVAISEPQAIKVLAGEIDDALLAIGMPKEAREYSPHLTLARCEVGRISPDLQRALTVRGTETFGAMEAAQFHLVQSRLKPSGAEYSTLASYPVKQETR